MFVSSVSRFYRPGVTNLFGWRNDFIWVMLGTTSLLHSPKKIIPFLRYILLKMILICIRTLIMLINSQLLPILDTAQWAGLFFEWACVLSLWFYLLPEGQGVTVPSKRLFSLQHVMCLLSHQPMDQPWIQISQYKKKISSLIKSTEVKTVKRNSAERG